MSGEIKLTRASSWKLKRRVSEQDAEIKISNQKPGRYGETLATGSEHFDDTNRAKLNIKLHRFSKANPRLKPFSFKGDGYLEQSSAEVPKQDALAAVLNKSSIRTLSRDSELSVI